jgi:intracellular sulfur oxidation DsrE/DsrF family protein
MILRGLSIGFLLLTSGSILADEFEHAGVDGLIAADREPDGVVFELIAWDDNTWDWAAPMIESFTHRLRHKYPEVDIALVSHGAELFDLALEQDMGSDPAIRQLRSISDENVDIHVCGNYASYKGLGDGDFLPFVDVSPSASAQLADYRKLGFAHILLEKPNGVD